MRLFNVLKTALLYNLLELCFSKLQLEGCAVALYCLSVAWMRMTLKLNNVIAIIPKDHNTLALHFDMF